MPWPKRAVPVKPEAGRLSVCSTPIGNLGDVTVRVLETLREANVILAEDTRITRRLLAHYDIKTPLERFDEHTALRRAPEVVSRLMAGEWLALVSDAGMPGVSDPGSTLVEAALDAGAAVEVLPGASAVPTALVASGLPTRAFYFGGFLPRKAGERRRLLDGLCALDATLIFYESPHRTAASLAALAEAFPERVGAMARELTKLHEEVVRAPLPELAAQIATRETLKGEVVLLVGPPAPGESETEVDADFVRARVDALVATGTSRNAAVKSVASELGIARNLVYEIAHASS